MTQLATAYERASQRDLTPPHPIPPMTDRLGQYWQQPSRNEIEVDSTHALMSQAVFDQLRDYSYSYPTGTYSGKMWKCGRGKAFVQWYLCWYGDIVDDTIAIHRREILIA